jgi:hypothetical protein
MNNPFSNPEPEETYTSLLDSRNALKFSWNFRISSGSSNLIEALKVSRKTLCPRTLLSAVDSGIWAERELTRQLAYNNNLFTSKASCNYVSPA